MSKSQSETQDCIESRTKRALDECMTVLPNHGRADGAPGLFVVIGENGNGEYLVDTRTGSCECADAEYRDPAGGCKHVRRCRIATGESPVPADALGEVTIDETFGAHVDGSAKFATADGGIINGETGEILEDDDDNESESEDEDTFEAIIEDRGPRRGTCCDVCGCRVKGGFYDDAVVCHDCARARRRDDRHTILSRIRTFGGGSKVDEHTTLSDLGVSQ